MVRFLFLFVLCSCILDMHRVSRVVRKLFGKVSHEKVCWCDMTTL